MTKPLTLGLPADYADWLAQSCPESLIGQQFADQLRQQLAAQMFLFHIMMLLTKKFMIQAMAQTYSLKMSQPVGRVSAA